MLCVSGRVKSFFLSIGLKRSKGNPFIFYYYNDNVLQGLIAIFVDDFLWSGTNDFETSYISKLHKNFVIGKENHSVFQYLGLHLEENDSGFTWKCTMRKCTLNFTCERELVCQI